MPKYHHILFATDFNEHVATEAKELADQFGAKLTLIHTIEHIPAYGYPGVVDLESALVDSVKKDMTALGKKLKIDESEQRVEFGSVKTQVLKVAEELNADLIIVGSHGRHGLTTLLGSSASGIIHGATCDVFVVRCKE